MNVLGYRLQLSIKYLLGLEPRLNVFCLKQLLRIPPEQGELVNC